jgi:hypothetical protein
MSSNAHRRVRPCARLAESSNAMSRSRAAPDSSSARADTYTARALPSDVGVEDHDAHCGARPDVPRMPAVGRRGQPPVVGLRVPHRRHPRHAGVVGCAEHHVLVRLDDASRHVAVVVMSCPSPPGRVGGSTEAQLIADYPQQQVGGRMRADHLDRLHADRAAGSSNSRVPAPSKTGTTWRGRPRRRGPRAETARRRSVRHDRDIAAIGTFPGLADSPSCLPSGGRVGCGGRRDQLRDRLERRV